MSKWKEYTRQELYDLVWATPMVKLAKEFGLSDVGLRKPELKARADWEGRRRKWPTISDRDRQHWYTGDHFPSGPPIADVDRSPQGAMEFWPLTRPVARPKRQEPGGISE
jgi:hypothetical protein